MLCIFYSLYLFEQYCSAFVVSEALETINFQRLNPNDIKYLDGIQVSLICIHVFIVT